LKGIFSGFEVTSAYVAVRRNGRSKGFGTEKISVVFLLFFSKKSKSNLTNVSLRLCHVQLSRTAEEGVGSL
jgi:hypothetical protein